MCQPPGIIKAHGATTDRREFHPELPLQYELTTTKTFILTSLLASLAYGSPLLAERQSCPASGITAARSAEVSGKFRSARVIPDSVPKFTPTTDLRAKYGNIDENPGNELTVLQTLQ
ncbi:hypothetical protein E8E11_004771 [Didymella keratinophila]|nr:hypothetical protein E8E11_004771 [Didymella keratinophila]